ncbi:hypothetical protein [Mesobacillus zeae]|uniref:hypothetical protein n=1 Tax=Mesobacillus zeae TaxID=1917180 RepID=UPI003009BF24
MASKLPPASDWQARDIETWNMTTFTQFIVDRTEELYGIQYTPGGGGAKSQRWLREKSMLKNAQGRYGNRVLKTFIEICWREYRTSKPELYPYPSVTFMISYMDRYFTEAVSQVAREARREKLVANAEQELAVDGEELTDWF